MDQVTNWQQVSSAADPQGWRLADRSQRVTPTIRVSYQVVTSKPSRRIRQGDAVFPTGVDVFAAALASATHDGTGRGADGDSRPALWAGGPSVRPRCHDVKFCLADRLARFVMAVAVRGISARHLRHDGASLAAMSSGGNGPAEGNLRGAALGLRMVYLDVVT